MRFDPPPCTFSTRIRCFLHRSASPRYLLFSVRSYSAPFSSLLLLLRCCHRCLIAWGVEPQPVRKDIPKEKYYGRVFFPSEMPRLTTVGKISLDFHQFRKSTKHCDCCWMFFVTPSQSYQGDCWATPLLYLNSLTTSVYVWFTTHIRLYFGFRIYETD